jgi:uncharacterized protein YceH (UPF0502 family)
VDHTLSETEIRVLGSLIEKEITTPDYYPLSLNALVAACNQSSNRHPVMHLDESTVISALDGLREKQLVHIVDRSESRVTRYRHVLYEALNLGRPAIAVMCVLMLRGPQTIGEIRSRTNRLYDFSSLEEVETTLNTLASGDHPFVVCLPRQSGQKEARYAHLMSGQVDAPPPELDRVGKLEKDLEDLRREFEEFRRRFE